MILSYKSRQSPVVKGISNLAQPKPDLKTRAFDHWAVVWYTISLREAKATRDFRRLARRRLFMVKRLKRAGSVLFLTRPFDISGTHLVLYLFDRG
jgi:hypothetical protein